MDTTALVLLILTAIGFGTANDDDDGDNNNGDSGPRFCDCAFDCLTPEGIRHHDVKLTGEI